LVDGDTPDAAARFPGNNTPVSGDAWFYGDLAGTNSASLTFDLDEPGKVSPNFPVGTDLSPGEINRVSPYITPLAPIAGAIGDPTNPKAFFGAGGLNGGVTITATSTTPAVVPNSNLSVTSLGNNRYALALEPVGVGYSRIDLEASDGFATARASFQYAASGPSDTQSRYHTWVSDASTAIPIDSDYMFVGDDENQVIRIYRRKESGEPIAAFDMTPYLGLTDFEDGRPREVDIEASTHVGNRIYWIGAHSHANISEIRTNRSRLFATDATFDGTNSTLTYVGRYDFLKLDMVNWDRANGHGKGANYYGLEASTAEGVLPKAPDGSGFNIEGLVMAPFDPNVAYIGLRAPLVPTHTRTHALIVPVLNFATLAASTAAPSGSAIFGTPIELDLYDRGIRSLECVGGNYLIVAGIPGDNPGEYPRYSSIYTWTGNPADRPQERDINLQGRNPEGIIELPPLPWGPNSLVHIINDNGRTVWYNDGIPGKDVPVRNFKKFQSDIVALGPVLKTRPRVLVERQGANITIHWRSVVGDRYRVLFKSALDESSWTALSGDVTATSTYTSKTDSNPPATQRFYKVEVLE
jgi:hypothetical protein